MAEWIAYLLLGAGAGVLAGLLGIGGGLIIVPVLAWLFTAAGFDSALIMHLAVGTSLATIIITSISSIKAHHRRGAVLWRVFERLTPGIVFGAAFGALVAHLLPTTALRTVFGVFELLVAVQMGFGVLPEAHRALPGRSGMLLTGSIIGGVSALLGIGGGTLSVPFLLWCRVDIRQAVATAAAVGLPIAIAATGGFIVTGWGHANLPELSLGYVYLPALAGIVVASVLFAPLGAYLAHTLPTRALKHLFAVVLAVLGLRMLLG